MHAYWWVFATPVVVLFLVMSPAWFVQLTPLTLPELPPLALLPALDDPADSWTSPTTEQKRPRVRNRKPAEVQGKIKNVVRLREEVVLEDGTRLLIPDSLRAARPQLRSGEKIWAAYQLQNGRRIATAVAIGTGAGAY
jgi:hypothetical protein